MCSSASPVRIRAISPLGSRPNDGVTSNPSTADSHGNRAPRLPRRRAPARAASRRRMRYSSMARAAAGWVAARNGSTNTSLSQKTWPRYPPPTRPRAPTAASPSSATEAIMWNSANRIASCSSGSPSSTTTSAASHRAAQAARCSASRRSKPSSSAVARAARASASSGAYPPRRSSRPSRHRSLSAAANGPGKVYRSVPGSRPGGPSARSTTVAGRASELNCSAATGPSWRSTPVRRSRRRRSRVGSLTVPGSVVQSGHPASSLSAPVRA